MDSFPDLPPVTAPPFSSNTAHPPYSEMITGAICALNDKDGSSRQAIAKYIERHYSNLPPTHPNLLTHHLKRMKNDGDLIMIKHSYAMPPPRPVPFQQPPPTLVLDNHFTDYSIPPAENDPITPRRKPGRPPKPTSHVQPYQSQGAFGSEPPPIFASLGLAAVQPVSENAVKRGRGRPPKGSASGGVEGGRMKLVNGGVVKRGRGRPKRIGAMMTVPAARPRGRLQSGSTYADTGSVSRGRGRPPKNKFRNAFGRLGKHAETETGSVSRSRGRPPKNKFRNSFGRPSKPVGARAGTAVIVTDPKQLVAYQELKSKYQHLQSKAKEVVGVVRPYINPDYEAFGALQELETLVEPSL